MSQDNSNNNNSNNLNESSSALQAQNQGMGDVSDKACDIEIYMGEQSNEMAKGVGTVMNGMGSKEGVMGGGAKADVKQVAQESK